MTHTFCSPISTSAGQEAHLAHLHLEKPAQGLSRKVPTAPKHSYMYTQTSKCLQRRRWDISRFSQQTRKCTLKFKVRDHDAAFYAGEADDNAEGAVLLPPPGSVASCSCRRTGILFRFQWRLGDILFILAFPHLLQCSHIHSVKRVYYFLSNSHLLPTSPTLSNYLQSLPTSPVPAGCPVVHWMPVAGKCMSCVFLSP